MEEKTGKLSLLQNFHPQAARQDIMFLDAEEHLDDLPLSELQQLMAHVDPKKNKCDVKEQMTDGEMLLQQTVSLLACLKEENNYCMSTSPAEFISGILEHFDKSSSLLGIEENCNRFQKNMSKIDWASLGQNGVNIFGDMHYGCPTIRIGPLDISLRSVKQGKLKRIQIPDSKYIKPEVLDNSNPPDLQSKDLNKGKSMDTEVKRLHKRLLKEKNILLDSLVFEDSSFGRAVENIFALSFLVRDGNAEIIITENGDHHIVTKNAPTAEERSTGVQDTQFVFRLDYKDWKEKQQKRENMAKKRKQMDIDLTLKKDEEDMESMNVSAPIRGLERPMKKIKVKMLARRSFES